MHRIPGLSDRFIYFNDDLFLLKERFIYLYVSVTTIWIGALEAWTGQM